MGPQSLPAGISRCPTEIFAALANRERRAILLHLGASATPQTLAELAQQLSTDLAFDSEGSPETLQIRLYHRHIPKLAEADLVKYDSTTDTASLSSKGQDVAELLSSVFD